MPASPPKAAAEGCREGSVTAEGPTEVRSGTSAGRRAPTSGLPNRTVFP
jgi:hypothetical protein